MSQERNRVLAGELVSRASVEAAVRGSIDEAVAACDFDRAASIALARAKAGEKVDVSRILPGLELPATACALIAVSHDKKALLEPVTRHAFPRSKDAAEIEAIVLYAAWRAGADTQRIIPELRRLAARQMTAEGYALLSTIAASIDDANVRAACKPIATFAKEYAKQVASDDKAMTASIDAVLAALPASVESSRGGFTVRADKQVGRNDPCPCGSGLKYKKCCADKPAAAPSPIPGLSWDEFLAGDKLTPEHVTDLPLRELVRVDVAKVPEPVLQPLFSRFVAAHQWTHAERVVDEAERRGGPVGPDLRDQLADHMFEIGDLDRAKHHLVKLPLDQAKRFDIELAIADGGAAAYAALVEATRAAVTSADKLPDIDLAYALLRAEPVLGILAARACIGTLHVDDPDLMLELVEEARDRLNLPPTDPAWDVLDALTVDKKKKQAADDAAHLRETIAESSARVDQLERALAAVRTELADAKTRPAAELMRQPELQKDKLDAKVRELEALIREGNEERRELRKQLEAAAVVDESARGPRGRRGAV